MDEKAGLIRQLLEASDGETRIAAARQLAELTPVSMSLFSLGLGDDDWRVRKAAVEAFSRLKSPEVLIADLIKLLHHHDNVGLRNAAIEILIGLGPRAVPELQRELTCSDVEVRKFIVDVLGEIGDPGCGEGLLDSLGDADINVRYAVVETLGKLRVRFAVNPLLELMDNPDPGLKFTILQALASIGGAIPTTALFPYLNDRLLRKALFDCFGQIGGKAVLPHLVEGLLDPMRPVREAALLALHALHVQEHESIRQLLDTADSRQIAESLEPLLSEGALPLREAALTLYGFVANNRDLRRLLSCVAEERLRSQVLAAFSALGVESYAGLVNSIIDPDPTQWLYLVYVGGELGFEPALPLALEGAQSRDSQLRYASTRALGQVGGQAQLGLLLQLLDDEVSEIREAATLAIAELGRRCRARVLEQIAPLLADQSADKRMCIMKILGLIDGRETEALLLKGVKDSSSTVRCEAIRALKGHSGEAVISGLILALTDEVSEVRRLAVSALGHCTQARVLPALKLAAGDADIWVRATVMRALSLFSGDDVRELLLQGLVDPGGLVVIAALETAAVVLPGERQNLLEQALNHQDEEVVKVAIRLLDRYGDKRWIVEFCSSLINHSHADVRAHVAKVLGLSALDSARGILEERLSVETEVLVRQALKAAVENSRCADNRDH